MAVIWFKDSQIVIMIMQVINLNLPKFQSTTMRAVYDASAIAAAAVAAAAAAAVEAGRRGRLRGGSARFRRWVRICKAFVVRSLCPVSFMGKQKSVKLVVISTVIF